MTNCYVGRADGCCVLVDPGDEPQTVLDMLGGVVPDMIFVTHPHFDHIGALADVAKATGAPIAASKSAVGELLHPKAPTMMTGLRTKPVEKVDLELVDGQVVKIGSVKLQILHTPGHHPGSICIYDEDDGVLFSGDTLFKGTCGRTDFPGGSYVQIAESLKRLAELPSETRVYPGHEGFTTIGNERNWIARV